MARKRKPRKPKRPAYAAAAPTTEHFLNEPAPLNLETASAQMEEDEEDYLEFNYDLPGSAPGTLNIPDDALPTELVLIDYSQSHAEKLEVNNPGMLARYLKGPSVSWLDVRGLGTEAVLRRLGDAISLHPLVLEDVVNVPQRPKIDYYEDHILIIMQMVRPKPSGKSFTSEQVSFVLNKRGLLTFQEEPSWDSFEPVRDRIQRKVGIIRNQGADFLMYTLMDTIIDSYFPVLERLGEYIETLEDEVVENPTRKTIEEIHDLRRKLMNLRRAIWPQRSVVNSLIRDSSDLITPEIRIYLQDCYDHIVQVLDIVETYREIASSLMDVYLSSISNRMNEVMKLLTVISTIFIPLTFVAGVYGMNFNPDVSPWNMPELNWAYGYPLVWGVMLAIAGSLILFFRRRGWFENFSATRR